MYITIGFDRIKLKHSYSDSLHGHAEYQQIHEWKGSVTQGDFDTKGKVWKPSKLASLTNINLHLPEGGSLTVMYGQAGGKQCAWFQINPRKLSPSDLATLRGHLTILLDDGFGTLMQSGMVSYAEIAIDVHGASFADYLYVDKFMRTGNGGYEKLGTAYLGSLKSDRRFTCYDKSSEQEGKGIYAEPTLRLEAKLSGTKQFPLNDVLNLASPFASLLVIDRQALAVSKHPLARKFCKAVQHAGVSPQKIYYQLPNPQRQVLYKVLSELQPDWWKPPIIWTGFADSLGWLFELLPADELAAA
jgi:hypothetical protein